MRRFPLALALIAAGTPVAAGEIEDVIVTAPAGPLATHLLDEQALAARRASATGGAAALLRGLPGAALRPAGGTSALPVVRGLADERLRVRIDGAEPVASCPNHMNAPFSLAAPALVEEVTAWISAVPVSQGGDSLGGTLVVESPAPRFAEGGEAIRSLHLTSGYRDNGDGRTLAVGGELGGERLAVRYDLAVEKALDYRAGGRFKAAGPAAAGRGWLAADAVGSSAFERRNQRLALAALSHAGRFELDVGLRDIPFEGFPNQRMDLTAGQDRSYTLRHTHTFADGTSWVARLYRVDQRHEMNFGRDRQRFYGPADGMPMESEGVSEGIATLVERAAGAGRARFGAEWHDFTYDEWWPPSGGMMGPEVFWNLRDGRRERAALFAEWEGAVEGDYRLLAGLRREWVTADAGPVQGYNAQFAAEAAAFNARSRKRAEDHWDFALALGHAPFPGLRWEVGLTRKTRSPSLHERYPWSSNGMAMRMVNFFGDGNGYLGNPDLEPEIAHTASLAVTWEDPAGAWSWTAAPYYSWIEDYIDAVPCPAPACVAANAQPGFRYLTFANQRARLAGLDLAGRLRLPAPAGVDALELAAAASYLDGENERTGDGLAGTMPLFGSLALEAAKGLGRLRLEWEWVADRDEVSRVRNEVPTAGYGLVHLRLSWQRGDLRLDLGAENLLDTYHESPLAGAYLGQGATMSAAGAPWGVPLPGPGRALYGVLSLTL
ncbi:MAG: TonB-dependent receptor [Porticoccaceae bacterium]|nr:MAG: TonB-dependent receptor [Porticoccaceae bacterium]